MSKSTVQQPGNRTEMRNPLGSLAAGLTDMVDGMGGALLRWGVALLWLSNVSWKVPPSFGRSGDSCRALCRYLAEGASHPVLPGSGWFFREIAVPNLAIFGWLTLMSEVALVALLISGRLPLVTFLLGVGTSFGIFAAVANADGEWYWSYLLMMAAHLGLFLVRGRAGQLSGLAAGWLLAGYGVVVALVHLSSDVSDQLFTWFDGGRDVPDDVVQNVFPGSMLLGLLLVLAGMAALAATRKSPQLTHWLGVGLGVVAALMVASYGPDGTLVGLGSRASTASVVAGAAVALWFASDRSADGDEAALAEFGAVRTKGE